MPALKRVDHFARIDRTFATPDLFGSNEMSGIQKTGKQGSLVGLKPHLRKMDLSVDIAVDQTRENILLLDGNAADFGKHKFQYHHLGVLPLFDIDGLQVLIRRHAVFKSLAAAIKRSQFADLLEGDGQSEIAGSVIGQKKGSAIGFDFVGLDGKVGGLD